MPGMLSERIAALRKERGLTQEQLGKMAGVSSQAVGKWEKGGAPDVELLPVLSRQLGVTMDALFGLEGGEQVDVEDAVGRWLRGFPNKERMGQFCRLVWASVKYFLPDGLSLPEIGYLETCQPDLGDDDRLMLSQCWGGDGILLDIHAEVLRHPLAKARKGLRPVVCTQKRVPPPVCAVGKARLPGAAGIPSQPEAQLSLPDRGGKASEDAP